MRRIRIVHTGWVIFIAITISFSTGFGMQRFAEHYVFD